MSNERNYARASVPGGEYWQQNPSKVCIQCDQWLQRRIMTPNGCNEFEAIGIHKTGSRDEGREASPYAGHLLDNLEPAIHMRQLLSSAAGGRRRTGGGRAAGERGQPTHISKSKN